MKKFNAIIICACTALFAAACLGRSTLSNDNTPARQANSQFKDLVRNHVERLCQKPRYGASLGVARDYIIEQLRLAGWDARVQEFTTSDGETYQNIRAVRHGKNSQRYIIGAHYDACDTGGQGNPGADDNASGVAALLAIARLLPEDAPECTVELVAWACEEPPWFGTNDMGSARHAAGYTDEQVLGMISLEMLGYYRHEDNSQPSLFPGYSLLLPTRGDFVAVVGDLASIGLAKSLYASLRQEMPAVRLNVPFAHDTALYFSDHRNYAQRDIPSVMVTDTAMIRNPNYHEPTDTPETLDYNNLALVSSALARAIRTLAW